MLKVAWIPGKGRGVITTRSIKKGDVIEVSPVCPFPPEHRKVIAETALSEYCFVRPCEYDRSKEQANGHIVFGLSSFCNHSGEPNAVVKWVMNDLGLLAHLTALRDIQSREEITLFYVDIDTYSMSDTFV